MAEKNQVIYTEDKVICSQRWAGCGVNPYAGRTGEVVHIGHRMQYIYNRDYITVIVYDRKSSFETWLYTLDLTERNPKNSQLLESGKLFFLDDLVEVTNKDHFAFGRQGVVSEIDRRSCRIIDKSSLDRIMMLNLEIAREEKEALDKALSDNGAYLEFRVNMKGRAPEFYEAAKQVGSLRALFEDITRQRVFDELVYQPQREERRIEIGKLFKDSTFYAGCDSLKIIKRFPENNW